MRDPTQLPMRHDGMVLVVIETPSGSGNKLKFDEDLGVYRLDRVLPAGMTFPFDFGFVPETLAEDGDPLDVIVLLGSPVAVGCVVQARLLGVIESEQQEKGGQSWERNDRLVAVAGGPKGHAAARSLDDVDPFRLEAIESFFVNYHALDEERFRIVARRGIRAAEAAIRTAHDAYLAERAQQREPAAAPRMSAMRAHPAVPGRANVEGSGDRGWPETGRDRLDRLASQVRKLARAIDRQVGVDEVHDMRTATRRLRTAITLYGGDAPRKRRVAVEDELKRVTRRLGAVRDLDVLLEDLEQSTADHPRDVDEHDIDPLRDAWRAERKSSARRLKDELDRGRFRKALRRAKRLVPDGSVSGNGGGSDAETVRVATQAPGLIWDAFGAVLVYELDPRTADPADIHRIRIAAKKLRYTLEAFEDALEPGSTLIDDVTALQDAAGSMHDAIVAGDRARSAVRLDRLTRRQRRAIDAFADVHTKRAEAMRPTIARRLRTIRSRPFRASLGRAVAGMGHIWM